MTVPRKFRRMAPALPMMVLHRAYIPPEDTQETLGVRCTNPVHALIDLACEQGMGDALRRQAVHEALARGLVRRSEFERKDMPPQLRRELEAIARTHAWTGGVQNGLGPEDGA